MTTKRSEGFTTLSPHEPGRFPIAGLLYLLRCFAVEVKLDDIAEIPRQAPVLGLRGSAKFFYERVRQSNCGPLFHWLILLVHTWIIRLGSEYLCNILIPYTII